MDEYTLPVEDRLNIVGEQIHECRRMIYRNNIENLSFVANNEKAKIKEVEYNNQTLKEKIDVLLTELKALKNETGGNPSV